MKRVKIIFLILVLVLILILVLVFFRQKRGTDEVKIGFFLEGPLAVRIGEEAEFKLKIANQENYELQNLEVKLEAPADFLIFSLSPEFNQKIEKGYIWFLKEISKGGAKEIVFKAKSFGRIGEKQNLRALCSFNLAGFAPNFEKKISFSFDLEPAVSLQVLLPEEANLGGEAEIKIFLKNLSDKDLEDFKLILPQNLTFKEDESIKKENEKTFYYFERLKPGEEQEKTLKAILKGNLGINDFDFAVQTGEDVLAENKKQIDLKKPEVLLRVKLDGTEATEKIADWGEKIILDLSFENLSEIELNDFRIKIESIDSKILNLEKTKVFKNNQAVFDKETNPEFTNLEARAKGDLNLNLFLKEAIEAATSRIEKGELNLKISFDYSPSEAERVDLIQKEIKIKTRTVFEVRAESRYYSDDYQPLAIGEGPLPFRVDEETKFWLFFRLKNTSNPLNEIEIKTILSEKLVWFDVKEASSGSLSYNEESREIIWRLPRLDSYQGGPYSLVEAKAKVSFKPTEEDQGKIVPLTSKIEYLAEDDFTKERLKGEIAGLTSRLSDSIVNWQGEIR